jgi:hypothetical protein
MIPKVSTINWWPTTKALNFQGKEAEHFKDLFLRHTLVEVEQPEPSLSSDESVWIDLPDPSSLLGAQGSARDEKHRKVPRSLTSVVIHGLAPAARFLAAPSVPRRQSVKTGDNITLISREPLADQIAQYRPGHTRRPHVRLPAL